MRAGFADEGCVDMVRTKRDLGCPACRAGPGLLPGRTYSRRKGPGLKAAVRGCNLLSLTPTGADFVQGSVLPTDDFVVMAGHLAMLLLLSG